MNIERWLQARREGRLSAIPLGMLAAMTSSSDENAPFDMFLDGHGNGLGLMYGPPETEYVSGNGQDESFLGSKWENRSGNSENYYDYGYGNGFGYHESIRGFLSAPCLTQRLPKD